MKTYRITRVTLAALSLFSAAILALPGAAGAKPKHREEVVVVREWPRERTVVRRHGHREVIVREGRGRGEAARTVVVVDRKVRGRHGRVVETRTVVHHHIGHAE